MKYSIIFILIVLSFYFFVACTPKTNNGNSNNYPLSGGGDLITFQTISEAPYSGIEQAKNLVITNDKSWDQLWDEIQKINDPKPSLPSVNFEKETIAAAFLGMRNSGGYAIRIDKIIDTGSEFHVFTTETAPPKGSMSTMALTQPYHIVKFDNPESRKVLFITK